MTFLSSPIRAPNFGQTSNGQNNDDLERTYLKSIANRGSTYCISPPPLKKRSKRQNVHFDDDGAIVVGNTILETQEESWYPMTQDQSQFQEEEEEEEVPGTENQDHRFTYLLEAANL